jgi:ribonuclease D
MLLPRKNQLDLNMTEPYLWIRTDEALATAAEQWSQSAVIALDTEFVRTDTFYANLGLIQVGIESQVWLIDPLEISQWGPLTDILASTEIVKVLHSLSEDAEVLQHHLKATFNNVFDTQIAASLLGRPVQVSYARLVEDLFEVALPKEATRSDWMRRPLDEQQCEYAAADVYWLYRVYQRLAEELNDTERNDWVAEDSQRMIDNNKAVPVDQYYLKLRGGWKLKSQRLLALKHLCAWREGIARATNTNRGRILQDKDLITIAEKMPTNKALLQKQLKLPSRKIRFYGDQILALVRQAEDARRSEWPERIPGPLPADQASLLKNVREVLSTIAEQHDIPAEVLARRRLVEEWLRSGCNDGQYQLPDTFNGWRRFIFVEQIQAMLDQQWESLNEA